MRRDTKVTRKKQTNKEDITRIKITSRDIKLNNKKERRHYNDSNTSRDIKLNNKKKRKATTLQVGGDGGWGASSKMT